MTTALEGGEGSAARPGRSLPPGKTRYPLYKRLGGPQGRSGQVRKISPPPGLDPRNVQPVASRYNDWATRPTDCEYIEVYKIFTLVTIRLKSQLTTSAALHVVEIIIHIYMNNIYIYIFIYISSKLETRCYITSRVIIWRWKYINLLKTKRNLLYGRNQSLPRCKHFPPRL